MARISRKSDSHKKTESKFDPESFRTAIYVRLSVEDNGKEDADSLENQIALLQDYLRNHPNLKLVEIYSDNGFTGTDFDRPAFTRLFADVQKGRINCIVVKDFSRLGRNYIETGEYLEKIFRSWEFVSYPSMTVMIAPLPMPALYLLLRLRTSSTICMPRIFQRRYAPQ